jgi:hypothetical protein
MKKIDWIFPSFVNRLTQQTPHMKQLFKVMENCQYWAMKAETRETEMKPTDYLNLMPDKRFQDRIQNSELLSNGPH